MKDINVRIKRLESLLQREISRILFQECQDSQLKFVSIVGVKLTKDLSYAKVFVSILSDNKKEEIMLKLQGVKNFIKNNLTKVGLKKLPEIKFVHDTTIQESIRFEKLLESIKNA